MTEFAVSKELTDRECEVLLHISFGYSNRETSVFMKISEETVKSHVIRIKEKLGAKNRAHAVMIALRNGDIL